MRPYIIITVPHARCPKDPLAKLVPHHLCDFIAPLVARLLDGKIQVPHRLLIGDTNRNAVDLNRPTSRSHPFRQTIRDLIEHHRGDHQVWVLDIHSFPHGLEPYTNSEMAFLEDVMPPQPYTKDLANWMRLNDILARIIGPAHPKGGADIETEARGLGVPAMLIEFNESLGSDRLQEITDLLAIWANNPPGETY